MAAAARRHAREVLTQAGIADPEHWIDRPPVPRRGGAAKSLRAKVGERDGWICCICTTPVDPAHQWVSGPSPDDRARAAQLVQEDDPEQLMAWMAGHPVRAAAVRAAIYAATDYAEIASLPLDARPRRSVPWQHITEVEDGWQERNHPHPSLEHVLPVCVGGTNHPDNLRIAHFGCNVAGRPPREAVSRAAANRAIIMAVNGARVAASVAAAAAALDADLAALAVEPIGAKRAPAGRRLTSNRADGRSVTRGNL